MDLHSKFQPKLHSEILSQKKEKKENGSQLANQVYYYIPRIPAPGRWTGGSRVQGYPQLQNEFEASSGQKQETS